ncbi:MAG: hypothetical protein WCO25_02335 [Candidatus Uhrbacteria bacterium]
MERRLFDKPMSELREAFVRARFAEPKMFGSPDVESTSIWVNAPAFHAWLKANWNGNDVVDGYAAVLERVATRASRDEVLRSLPDMKCLETARTLLGSLDADTSLYHSPFSKTVVLVRDHTVLTLSPNTPEEIDISVRPASVFDVCWVVSTERLHGRPKAEAALAWLRQQYAAAILSVRESAERDFDEAVAVSAYGTKIVKAKWVIAVHVERNGVAWLFPASAFRENKVRLRQDVEFDRQNVRQLNHFDPKQFQAYMTKDPTKSFLEDARHTLLRAMFERKSYAQRLITIDDRVIKDFGSVLVANVTDCPSPLPSGSRIPS